MVRSGDTVAFIDFVKGASNEEQVLSLDRARRAGRITTRLCYCSVFEDCWIADSRDPTPDRVSQCTAPKIAYRE